MEFSAVRRVSIRLPGDEQGEPEPGRPTVLVVTADADLRLAGSRALERAGYAVLTARHSGHAQLAAMRGRRMDVVATDIALDDMSGPALVERLRRLYPDLQAIYFAGPGTPECEGVLVRPFTRDELIEAVAGQARPATSTAS